MSHEKVVTNSFSESHKLAVLSSVYFKDVREFNSTFTLKNLAHRNVVITTGH